MSYAPWVPQCPSVNAYSCSISTQGDYTCMATGVRQESAEHFSPISNPQTNEEKQYNKDEEEMNKYINQMKAPGVTQAHKNAINYIRPLIDENGIFQQRRRKAQTNNKELAVKYDRLIVNLHNAYVAKGKEINEYNLAHKSSHPPQAPKPKH